MAFYTFIELCELMNITINEAAELQEQAELEVWESEEMNGTY